MSYCMSWSQGLMIYVLILHRLPWSNGSNGRMCIFISYWRWRVDRYPTSALSAVAMHISSVLIASGHPHFADTAFQMPTDILHFIGHSSGLLHIIPRYPCNHLGLLFILGIQVHHVQKLLRYAHIMYSNIWLFLHYSNVGIRAAQLAHSG
jgi:hypothetical protein